VEPSLPIGKKLTDEMCLDLKREESKERKEKNECMLISNNSLVVSQSKMR